MKTTHTNRQRYYLHGKVRKFTKVNARHRQVEVHEALFSEINKTQHKYLILLRDIYGYNLQYNLV